MTLYSNRVALNCNPIINYYGPHYVGRIRNICVFDRGPYKVANLKTGPQYDGKKLFLKKFK
jgi:hypothetical protein